MQGLLVDLGIYRVVELAVVPAQLDVIQDLLDELVLPLIVLPPDEVQIRRSLHDELVVLQSKR